MKKVLVLLISFITVFSCIVYPPVGYADTSKEQDRISLQVQTLTDLEILPENYSLNGEMTRGEFAQITANIFRNYTEALNGVNYFNDTPQDDEQMKNAINLLAALGVIKGDTSGNFMPDSAITYEDAVVILLRALGYEIQAGFQGGYHTGYLVTATRAGLTTGIDSAAPLNRKIAVLLYNALECPVMKQVVWGNDENYAVDQDSALLESVMHLRKYRGRLYGAGECAISDSYTCDEMRIKVGQMEFVFDDISRAEAAIGRTVTVYYAEDGQNTAVSLEPDLNSSILTLDLSGLRFDLENNRIEYLNDYGKKATAAVALVPYIVYNGRPATAIPEQLTGNGNVTLVSNDSGIYDLIVIRDYATYQVKQISSEGTNLQTEFGDLNNPLPDFNQVEDFQVFGLEGERISLQDIQVNDVLSVLKSADGDYYGLYISRETRYGKVNEIISEYEGTYTVVISGERYETTPELTSYINRIGESSVLGMLADFCLDINGKIAGWQNELWQREETLGWMTAVSASTNVFGTPQIKVFTQDGVFKTLSLSEKMSFNGSKKINGQSACDWFAVNENAAQIIKFSQNEDGEVDKIITAGENADGLYSLGSLASSTRYRTGQRCFGSKIILDENAIVFIIPSGTADDDAYYQIADSTTFGNNGQYSNLQFYTTSNNKMTADIVVHRRSFDGNVSDTCPDLIKQISSALNGNGEIVQRVTFLRNGAEYNYDVKSGSDALNSKLQFPQRELTPSVSVNVGDLVRSYTNTNDEICNTEMIYSYRENRYYPTSNPYTKDAEDNYRFGIGVVTASDGTIIQLTYDGSNEVNYFNISASKITVVEKRREEVMVREGTVDDVIFSTSNDRVFVYSPLNNPTAIYVFKDV